MRGWGRDGESGSGTGRGDGVTGTGTENRGRGGKMGSHLRFLQQTEARTHVNIQGTRMRERADRAARAVPAARQTRCDEGVRQTHQHCLCGSTRA